MDIKVLGPGCKKCKTLYNEVCRTIEEEEITANVEKVEDIMEIMKYGALGTPGLVVDGKLVSSGKVLSKEEILKFIKK